MDPDKHSSVESGSSAGDASVLSRDWTVTAHALYYATGDGKLLLEDVTIVIPSSSCCALVGPSVADKGSLLRLLSGAARGGYFAGKLSFGGSPYSDAHLLSTFIEAPHVSDWESSYLGGSAAIFDTLTPAEAIEYATYLRFGFTRDATRGAERWTAIMLALGLDDSLLPRLSHRATAVLTRIACAIVRSPPVVCVEDPFRGLEPAAALAVADALAGLTARGFTLVASLDAAGLSESVFERAFSRAVVMRDGRVLYCGEARHAATHCAGIIAGTKKRLVALRLDAMEQCAGDAMLSKRCRDAYLTSATARRIEQEASHVEAIDEERSSVHWLSPPYVAQATKARVLLLRSLRRASRGSHLLGLPVFSERHLGAIGVALVWGAAFWDAARLGRDSLSYYDLTAVAFACGQIAVAATLAAAPELCRRHAEFERERRARDCFAFEHVVTRTIINMLDAAALGVAPLTLYVSAGLPVGPSVLCFVYGMGCLLAFSCSALVEALAAWTHAPPAADSYGGGGVDFETERSVARRAERITRGAFGMLMSCMLLSAGFGIELGQLRHRNPFFWHSRINHLRWYVQGIVLRVHGAPHFHSNVELTGTGFPRYRPVDTLVALLLLAAAARLVSAYFLSIDPPKLRHVEARKLSAWATKPPSATTIISVGGTSEDMQAQVAEPLEDDGGVAEKKLGDKDGVGAVESAKKLQAEALLEGSQSEHEDEGQTTALLARRDTSTASRAVFAAAIEGYAVSLAAHDVSLAWKRRNRVSPIVADVSLSVSSRESLLICGDDKDAPRCVLRALAGRDCRRGDREIVGGSGRIAVNGAKRQRDWRRKCAWLAAHEGRVEAVLPLSPREAVSFALRMGTTRAPWCACFSAVDGASSAHAAQSSSSEPQLEEGFSATRSYVARGADGAFVPPAAASWWIEVALDVAGVPRSERDSVIADIGALSRRRIALACELVLAPVVVFCDDLGGGARGPSAGSREALSPRDTVALAATCASLARLGCAVVATACSPTRAAVVTFDRVALLVTRRKQGGSSSGGAPSSISSRTTSVALSTGFSYLAVDDVPEAVFATIEKGAGPAPTKTKEPVVAPVSARDLEVRPLDAAIAELRRRNAVEGTGPDFQLGALDFGGGDALGAGSLVRPHGVGCFGAFAEFLVQLRRELAAHIADRNVLGATLGAPFANAALLCVAFWNQGHDDPRIVLWLGYCLLAAFLAPASVALPRLAASARTFGVEADADLASPLPFALAQLLAPIPFVAVRALLVVPLVFASANFDLSLDALGFALVACVLAGFVANAVALAAVWSYTARAAPNAFALDASTSQRRRAIVAARANDLLGLVVLLALVFAGCFRFIADLDTPWRAVAAANFTRWLLHAIARPQLVGKHAPDLFDVDKSANEFVGYQNFDALSSLQKAALYGPAPVVLVALLVLARMRAVDRE